MAPPAKRARRQRATTDTSNTTAVEPGHSTPVTDQPTPQSSVPAQAAHNIPILDTPASAPSQDTTIRQELNQLQQSVAALTSVVQSLLPSEIPDQPTQHAPAPPRHQPLPNLPTLTPTPQGESVSQLDLPVLMFADPAQPGLHLTPKLRENIAAGKYVDFYDLLFPETEQAYSISLTNLSAGPLLSLAPRKRRPLDETEWCSAWDDYMAVYLHHHPLEVNDLIAYGKRIKSFMTTKQNWRFFDERFRRERESHPYSWASLRFDIQMLASHQPYNNQPLNESRNSNFRDKPFRSSPLPPVPKGHCFRFHTQRLRCPDIRTCTYQHICPLCKAEVHPMYSCPSHPTGDDPKPRGQTTASPSPPNTTKGPNPRPSP